MATPSSLHCFLETENKQDESIKIKLEVDEEIHSMFTCTFVNLSNQPIMWRQNNPKNRTDTGEEIQLMFTSKIRMGERCDLCDFNCGIVVVRLAGLSISETNDLLG